MEQDTISRQWRRTARGRLRFELSGIAFARAMGFAPEDWAKHLWSSGAVRWIGKAIPTAREYLLKEAEAFEALYPEVAFELGKLNDLEAELTFRRGCLGGWGKNQWAMAKSAGLGKGHVCRYCRQAFRSWASQLGLHSCAEPQTDETCILWVKSGVAAGFS